MLKDLLQTKKGIKMYLILFISFILSSLTVFSQPLRELQLKAAENDPDLLASYKSFEIAMLQTEQAGVLSDPQLSFGYFISPVETRVGPQQARLSLSQMFPWFGTLKLENKIATYHAEAAYQNFVLEKNRLFYQVADTYYPVLVLDGQIEIEEDNLKILESYQKIVTRRLESGTSSLEDALRVELKIEESENRLASNHIEKQIQIRKLKNELGLPDSSTISIAESLPDADFNSPQDSASIKFSHPILSRYKILLQSVSSASVLAKKKSLPKIGIGLDYVFVGQAENSGLTDSGKDAFMPMVTVSLPVFRGKYKADIKSRELENERLKLELESERLRLDSELTTAMHTIEKHLQDLALYEKQIDQYERILNLQMESYGTSGKDFEEVLRTQEDILKFKRRIKLSTGQLLRELAKVRYLTSS